MTVGQLIECVASKIGAINGEHVDGTPFNDFDVDSVYKNPGEIAANLIPKGANSLENNSKVFIILSLYVLSLNIIHLF